MQTIREFDGQFPTDESCKAYLAKKRWPNGVSCPRCGETERVYALKARPFNWVCKNSDPKVECGGRNGYRFSVLTGTIFMDTKIPLSLWFKVGYLMMTSKKGIPALQVHRVIFGEDSGSSYRTAWYMCQRWRAAMRGDAFQLDGTVEIDETYVGGKDRNRHKSKRSGSKGGTFGSGKVGVMGAISRKGNVVCQVIERMDHATVERFVNKTISPNVSLVCSDENQQYRFVYYGENARHEAVNHSADEYVRGDVHTANLDQFWSLLKRGIMGSFHHVSKKYLPLYLNEFSFRHNMRKNPDAFGALVTTCG